MSLHLAYTATLNSDNDHVNRFRGETEALIRDFGDRSHFYCLATGNSEWSCWQIQTPQLIPRIEA